MTASFLQYFLSGNTKGMRLFFISLLTLFSFHSSLAQSWEEYYSQIVEEYESDDESNTVNLEQLYDVISELVENPVNLNTITRSQLEQMLFLNNWQIEGILNYVDRYAPVRTYGELMMVYYLDPARRGLLSCVTYLGEAPERQLQTELDSLKFHRGLQEYKQWYNNSLSRGDAVASLQTRFDNQIPKNWIRANYRIDGHFRVGMVAAQDAGETYRSSGYDYYSGYLSYKNRRLNAIVGRYRIKTALGLVLNTNTSMFSPLSMGYGGASRPSVISPHTSRSEANYLQGAAASIPFSRSISLTAFASYRTLDATLNSDGSVKTILTSGYHKTDSEIERRHNTTQSAAGGCLAFNNDRFNLGVNAVFAHYNRELHPYASGSSDSQLYRKYMPSGFDFWNLSVSYGYSLGKRFSVQGETATDNQSQLATVNRVEWCPTSRLQLFLVQRYYPYKFNAVLGNSYSKNAKNNNESGIYLGAQWTPNSSLSLSAHTDIAYYAWYKYRKNAGTYSVDQMVQINYLPSSNGSLYLKYRWYNDVHRVRSYYSHNWGSLSARAELDFVCSTQKQTSCGSMAMLSSAYKAASCSLSAGAGYFSTQNYDSRIYLYEQSTPYSMAFLSFYGSGVHAYALAQISAALLSKYLSRLSLISKYSYTSTTHHDLSLALKYKF